MYQKSLPRLGIICSLLMVPSYASAVVVVDFDSLAPQVVLNGNINGVNLGGVTITSAWNDTTVISDFGVGYRSPTNAVTNSSFITNNPMTFVFDYVQNFVSLTGGDKGGDQDQFTVTAYDAASNILSQITTPLFGGNPLDPLVMVDFQTVQFNVAGIKSIVVSNAINAGIGIDDLQFEVPEPATLGLFGLGLAGIGAMRRKKLAA